MTVVDTHSLYPFYVDNNHHIQQLVFSNGLQKCQTGFTSPAKNSTSDTPLIDLGVERHPGEELAFSID